MKGLAAPLAALDGNALPLDSDAAANDDAAPAEGFDALLALLNAQSTTAPVPVKAMAPGVGVQCAPVETAKGAATAKAEMPSLLSGKHVDVGPTQSFQPWLGSELSTELSIASAPVQGVDGADAEPVLSENPAVAADTEAVAEPGSSAAVQLPSGEKSLKVGAKNAVGRKPALDEPASEGEGAPTAALSPVAPLSPPVAPVQPVVAAAKPVVASKPVLEATQLSTVAAQSAQGPEQPMLIQGAEQKVAPGFAEMVAAPPPVSIPMSDPETQAVVTSLEFFESSEIGEATELPTTEPSTEPALQKDEETSSDAQADLSGEAQEGAPDSEGEPKAQAEAPRAVAVPSFEVSEGKGMRGLDAVVASLLRPYQDKPEGGGGTRVPTASAPHVRVETGKSETLKTAERVGNMAQALDASALRREEERRGEARELLDATAPHQLQHLDMQAEAGAPVELAAPKQAEMPVSVPAPLPDPDAAMMGKLARGESLNAAISIEHPELGSLDLVVENANGRIDVRATLETPRAAAVLRAHESALRYGVQQAGMTFGALRVRARTGEAQVDRSRDVSKRRRDRDWEA
jgi:hypothetical protein